MVRNSCRASAKPSPVGNSALICALIWSAVQPAAVVTSADGGCVGSGERSFVHAIDRKSTRLNSSHSQISYAVFCLKKKKINTETIFHPSPHKDPQVEHKTETQIDEHHLVADNSLLAHTSLTAARIPSEQPGTAMHA